MPPSDLAFALAEFALGDVELDDAGMRLAGRAAFDTVAVAVAGAGEPVVEIVRATMLSGASGPAEVIGGGSAPAATAAMVNATAAHALDFDDVSHAMKGHPSTVLVPSLLAASATDRVTGPEFAAAYAVGLQINAAVWAALGPGHYEHGWHATSTVGVFGATAAVARVLGLSQQQATAALGVAASFAAGTRQNFGTMTKPLHAGHAAEWAVRACELARAGLSADNAAIEGPLGFLHLTSGRGHSGDALAALRVLSEPWVLTGARGLNVKQHACCYFAHRAVDALLSLPSMDVRDIDQIQVTVSPGTLSALRYGQPHSGLEGKFSGPYILAAALLDGALGPSSFTDEAVGRAEHRKLAGRITWREDLRPPLGQPEVKDGYAVVRRTSTEGTVDVARVDIPDGHAQRPLSDQALTEKARNALAFGAPESDLEDLASQLLDLGNNNDISQWARALRYRASTVRKEES